MIRIKLAEWLLRSTGAHCEFRVRRRHISKRKTDGSTILCTHKLREAKARYKLVRTGDNEQATIQLVATTHQRQDVVEGGQRDG